jgi:hypothetical protein
VTIIRRFVDVTCPYCGKVIQTPVDPRGELQPMIALCDIEAEPSGQGCDKYFVFTVTFAPSVVTYTLTPATNNKSSIGRLSQ